MHKDLQELINTFILAVEGYQRRSFSSEVDSLLKNLKNCSDTDLEACISTIRNEFDNPKTSVTDSLAQDATAKTLMGQVSQVGKELGNYFAKIRYEKRFHVKK